jgi:hypothetical protein
MEAKMGEKIQCCHSGNGVYIIYGSQQDPLGSLALGINQILENHPEYEVAAMLQDNSNQHITCVSFKVKQGMTLKKEDPVTPSRRFTAKKNY